MLAYYSDRSGRIGLASLRSPVDSRLTLYFARLNKRWESCCYYEHTLQRVGRPKRAQRSFQHASRFGVQPGTIQQLVFEIECEQHKRRFAGQGGSGMPASPRERHRTERIGWLCAAVLRANDGIVSTASLMLGVAAAHATHSNVLVAGRRRDGRSNTRHVLGRTGHGANRGRRGAFRNSGVRGAIRRLERLHETYNAEDGVITMQLIQGS